MSVRLLTLKIIRSSPCEYPSGYPLRAPERFPVRECSGRENGPAATVWFGRANRAIPDQPNRSGRACKGTEDIRVNAFGVKNHQNVCRVRISMRIPGRLVNKQY